MHGCNAFAETRRSNVGLQLRDFAPPEQSACKEDKLRKQEAVLLENA